MADRSNKRDCHEPAKEFFDENLDGRGSLTTKSEKVV